MSLNWAKKDLTGKKFGRLTVIAESKKRYSNGLVLWDCVCDCGNKKTVNGASLRKGATKSCGCFRLDSIRLGEGEASFNKLYKSYQRGSITRGIKFEIDKEAFRKITSLDCFYCGEKPKQEMKNNGKSNFYGNYKYNGIDRADNTKGYLKKNCVPCCFVCNQMKLTLSQSDFINKVKQICKHQLYETNSTLSLL